MKGCTAAESCADSLALAVSYGSFNMTWVHWAAHSVLVLAQVCGVKSVRWSGAAHTAGLAKLVPRAPGRMGALTQLARGFASYWLRAVSASPQPVCGVFVCMHYCCHKELV